MGKEREIKEAIRYIAGLKPVVHFTAEVVSVSGNTCTVKHGKLELTDVRLVAVDDDRTNTMLITPTDGSVVLVADLSNGDMRDLCIVQYSNVKSIVFNGGKLGGLINIESLVSKINELVDAFNSHSHTIASGAIQTAGSATAQANAAPVTVPAITNAASKLSKNDFEDTKIKH